MPLDDFQKRVGLLSLEGRDEEEIAEHQGVDIDVIRADFPGARQRPGTGH